MHTSYFREQHSHGGGRCSTLVCRPIDTLNVFHRLPRETAGALDAALLKYPRPCAWQLSRSVVASSSAAFRPQT